MTGKGSDRTACVGVPVSTGEVAVSTVDAGSEAGGTSPYKLAEARTASG